MKKYIFTSFLLLFSILVIGQASVNTSGGDVSNANGSLSYSIGQVFYQNKSDKTGAINQGVQQTYLISSLGLEDNQFNLSLSAYPNPTAENLNLRVANFNNELLTYNLLDAEGKLLLQGVIRQQETFLEMKSLPSASYFLEVHQGLKKVQTFKIIKNL
jgi:hypothetical protein